MSNAAIDFASLPTHTDVNGNVANFSVDMGLGEVISGIVTIGANEEHEDDVFIEVTRAPMFLADAKARELVADAIAKGRTLGIRPAFAKRARTIIVAGDAC